ncbi:hypothetical protein J2Z60_001481 [Lactobacillus colini]|uniref:S-layer protein C-terminal domain-containing protein n=2 Tax=Lactobacillus colini TaxID=1819254 RepID=A0ABS4MF33_9LACO|nr:SLAP domain-containing protein [Lactobacillus colini]MBP2058302.1 hypothetical protein [Lactobacillus colini]
MRNAIAYDKDGNKTKLKYITYGSVKVDATPVKMNGTLYYKVSDEDPAFKASGLSSAYIKATNLDGVKRKLKHNAYIYRTSNGRTSYTGYLGTQAEGVWKLYKAQTITTYGGSYKFKNGKRYYRVGGPRKQYVKVGNLGPVISTNTSCNANFSSANATTSTKPTSSEETTVTVTNPRAALCVEVPGKDAVQSSSKYAKKGEKFVVDCLEQGTRADTGSDGDDDNELAIYHIKGTDYWIYNNAVSAAKQLPVQNYYHYNNSYIKFTKNVDVYNADGTVQNHNGQKIRKQGGMLRVDNLIYIWVPSEQKAELFYHLVSTNFEATTTSANQEYTIEVGKNSYVKASDVEFIEESTKLTPSNTAEEAKAVYGASQSSNK